MAVPRKRALPFILPCGKFRLGCILTARLLRNMHRNLFLPLSAGIQRVVRAVPRVRVDRAEGHIRRISTYPEEKTEIDHSKKTQKI